jgi:predicted ATPase
VAAAATGDAPIAAYFTFDELCGPRGLRRAADDGGPLAAADVLGVADSGARVVFVEGLRALARASRDEARRLVTLVDVLYDRGVELYASSSVPIEGVFEPLLAAALADGADVSLGLPVQGGKEERGGASSSTTSNSTGSSSTDAAQKPGRAVGRDWGARPSSRRGRQSSSDDDDGSSLSAAGRAALLAEEVLMYRRATSRLVEMARGSRGGGGGGGGGSVGSVG